MKKIILLASILVLASCGTNNNTGITIEEPTKTEVKFEVKLNNGDVVAVMKTNKGNISILLDTKLAPITTNNFIGLAKKDFYDGIIFHRIIEGFMLQGGDPTGTGRGGESIYGNKFNDEFSTELSNTKYTISMANSGPDTNSSQFFINVADNTNLDFNKQPLQSKHAVFGKVIKGEEIADLISKVEVNKEDGSNKPFEDVIIEDIEILEFVDNKYSDFDFNEDEAIKFYENKITEVKNKEIESGDNISVHYTGTFKNGEKFDSSYDRNQTLDFTVGAGQMISGFDSAVVGMKIGDKKSITLEPKDAYGERDDDNTQIIKRNDLKAYDEAGIKLEKGGEFPTQYGKFPILESNDEEIVIDANNPMAGKTLNFDIEIINIK